MISGRRLINIPSWLKSIDRFLLVISHIFTVFINLKKGDLVFSEPSVYGHSSLYSISISPVIMSFFTSSKMSSTLLGTMAPYNTSHAPLARLLS